jgi:predicted ester cyclase
MWLLKTLIEFHGNIIWSRNFEIMKVKKKNNIDTLSKTGACIEFFSSYQEKDISKMMQLCDPSGEVNFEPLGTAGKGEIGGFGKSLWLALMAAFPDLDNTVIKAEHSEDNDSVVCTVSIFGTQQEEFAGIPSKGNRFESDHVFVFRFNREEKIDRININWDHKRFSHQLES